MKQAASHGAASPLDSGDESGDAHRTVDSSSTPEDTLIALPGGPPQNQDPVPVVHHHVVTVYYNRLLSPVKAPVRP